MSEVERIERIEAVWKHSGPHPKWRYVPKATGVGTAWKVWDRKQGQFLGNRELLKLPLAALRDEEFLS